jgi:hypothetical protein
LSTQQHHIADKLLFLIAFEKEIGCQRKLIDQFLQARVQARAHQFLTPKEHGFDMPTFLKYGSTG